MDTFASWLMIFTKDSPLSSKQQAAESMASYDPTKAWPILRDAFNAGNIEATIPGLLVLQQPRCIRLLQRALVEQGGSSSTITLILQALCEMSAIAELVELSEDPYTTAETRHEVLQLLSHVSTVETHQLFMRELRAPSLRRQILAIYCLGQWKVTEAVPQLTKKLRRLPNTPLRQSLCWSLGAIASHQAVRTLQSYLISAETSVQMEVAELLSTIPNPPMVEVLEAVLPFLHGTYAQQMTLYLNQLQQAILNERASQLEPWREQWEELLFDE